MAERDCKWWQDQIRNGQRFQMMFGQSRSWHHYKEYYRHKFPKGVLPVNQMFSIKRSMAAQTYLRNPTITVTPRKPGLMYKLHAKILESVDRWFIDELRVKGQMKKMVEDCFDCGIGVGFNGYDSEYGWVRKTTEKGTTATLTQFDKKGYRIEYNSFINPGMPWFLRSRPDDVVWPWGCTDGYNAEWVALRVLRPLLDLRKDVKYTVPSNMEGSYVPLRSGPEGEVTTPAYYNDMLEDRQWVELWQVHDAKTGKIFGLSMNHTDFLRKDKDEMQIEGLPVETLVFNPDPDFIYGVPDARIIEPQLLELNEIRTQAMKHRRIDILKLLYRKNAIDKEDINKLLDESVRAGIPVNEDIDITKAVLALPTGAGGIMRDMAFAAELVRQDIRETVGFSRVQQGEFQGKSHVTKAEVTQVLARSDIRMDDRRDAVADLLTNVVRKFNQTVFTHWTVPQVQDIVGPKGARWWLEFTGPEIRGEYTYKIEAGTAAPLDPGAKKKQAVEMAQAWAQMNAGAIAQGAPVPAEIQRYFFSQYEGIDVEKLLAQQGIQQPTSPNQPLPVPVAAGLMARGGAR